MVTSCVFLSIIAAVVFLCLMGPADRVGRTAVFDRAEELTGGVEGCCITSASRTKPNFDMGS